MSEQLPAEENKNYIEPDEAYGQSFDRSVETIETDYPVIRLLRDAESYRRENEESYLGMSGEELRTAKSISVLRRLASDDQSELLGEKAQELQAGYKIYHDIVQKGVYSIGDGDPYVGMQRMETVMAVHDLAKSRTVADAVAESHGVTDHDMAMSVLVSEDFESLNGIIDDESLQWLQEHIGQDERLKGFFAKERGIDATFNIGRHLQGESDYELFKKTVHEVDDVSLAEFTLDLLGSDGHQNPDGAVKFANIPPAFNGIAVGLQKLVASREAGAEQNDLFAVWQGLSYPQADMQRLGLDRSTDYGRAVTRLAFMGREHQLADHGEAEAHIVGLENVLQSEEPEARTRIVELLQDTAGMDIGFTPHVMDAMRKQVGSEVAYSLLVGIVDQIAVAEQVANRGPGVLTVNLDNKFDWSQMDAQSAIKVLLSEPDKAKVINAKFELVV